MTKRQMTRSTLPTQGIEKLAAAVYVQNCGPSDQFEAKMSKAMKMGMHVVCGSCWLELYEIK